MDKLSDLRVYPWNDRLIFPIVRSSPDISSVQRLKNVSEFLSSCIAIDILGRKIGFSEMLVAVDCTLS